MESNRFIFQLSSYNIDKLLPQVRNALEKRTELVSRERFPGLWKNTDQLNARSQGQTRSRLRTRIMSIICLALGIFLFIPGLVQPQELFVPLLVGALAIGAGIGGLWRSRKHKTNPFDKSARLLLEGKDIISTEPPIAVSFSEIGMTIPTENNNSECVPYTQFERIIETSDTFLLVHDTRATVLQKIDLSTGTIDEFCNFISEKVSKYHYCTETGGHML